MTEDVGNAIPVQSSDRILALDALRGFAILGILIMNIQSFSMIEAAYLNPAAYGDLTGINRWVWTISHILADQKFITIFSMLFGAGVFLMTSRVEARGMKSGGLHYRRIFWLLVIGLIHAYVFWHGDILVAYAVCGLLLFLFRKLSPKKLLIIGLILFSVSSILYIFSGISMSQWPAEAVEGTMQGWKPALETIQDELAHYRGGLAAQMEHRIPASMRMQMFVFFIWTGWRAGGLMLVGMALFKWGVLSAEKSKKFYTRLWTLGWGVGLILVITGIIRNFAAGWSLQYSMFLGSQFNYWGSLCVALGYIGMVMLMAQSEKWTGMTTRLSAVGRMALTNYLLHTLICTILFYGHGFGLFGKVERIGQILIVIAIWILQLIISPIWLRHFKFGPAEWLWRSLTYWKIQPFRLKA